MNLIEMKHPWMRDLCDLLHLIITKYQNVRQST